VPWNGKMPCRKRFLVITDRSFRPAGRLAWAYLPPPMFQAAGPCVTIP
jgi:hypothetical protein